MNTVLAETSRKTLLVPQGEFELRRKPDDANLQAWDAADELLLNHLDEGRALADSDKVLIVNDAFGALAVALTAQDLHSWSDSYLANQAMRDNLRANGLATDRVRSNDDIAFPSVQVDCVLLKIPKTLALLEHQLYCLRDLLHRDTRIVAAGMARHIHRSTLEAFEKILGPTTSTPAVKKSRLILVERDHSLKQGQSHYPTEYELQVDREYRIVNHANLFSRDRLDGGTRLLLEHMPVGEAYRHIADLGCGNGVIGLVAASLNPEAELLFCDESYMAVASARENFRAAFAQQRAATFRVDDCLQQTPDDSLDLVMINPPFHQQHLVGDAIAWKMLKDARRTLIKGGEVRMVGNHHLGYHAKLKKLFGNCTTIASDRKFVVLSATR